MERDDYVHEAQERHRQWWALERARRRVMDAYLRRADRVRYGLPNLPPTSEEQRALDAVGRAVARAWEDYQPALRRMYAVSQRWMAPRRQAAFIPLRAPDRNRPM
jgi:hypothetical protein